MNDSLIDKLQRRIQPLTTLLDRIGHAWLWLVLSLGLMLIVVGLNPAKFGTYVWFMSKLLGASAIGYFVDWGAFRGADPRYLDGIEKTMAQTRRATLIAAAIIGAGLIG
ncbi:MAG TPA: hypothetical protein VGE33_11990 [Thermomonas sp.]